MHELEPLLLLAQALCIQYFGLRFCLQTIDAVNGKARNSETAPFFNSVSFPNPCSLYNEKQLRKQESRGR